MKTGGAEHVGSLTAGFILAPTSDILTHWLFAFSVAFASAVATKLLALAVGWLNARRK